ncbi:tyrosine-type recombinase/integrase [Polaromonas naphthalenivorans]|uniref:Phage integrase family protein n=1 Tax=Polaromonas naphthalenivorans (strain CJ2) TaxID=365044 RepID=A1VKV9_POLNA|nr:site-specific integrase [Polaromonas naphthalenivorans]ABM36287.1 phage integrase family protein [Polaromonas naphthalenivorans CJ2]
MGKIAKEMGAMEVKRLTQPGLHPVGTVPGLRLSIKATGAKSWILRTTIGPKRCDIGLGSYPAVTLAAAWERARATLDEIRNGIDPVAKRKARQEIIAWTFKTCALAYIETHAPSWKNAKHGQQWRNTLETYVYPVFGDKHVRDVDTGDVTTAIRPLWSTKNETMVRVRNRIELVISWAAAQGYRPKGFNPATWRGHLDQVLPKPSKVNKRESFEAVPIDDMHAFMQRLRSVKGMSARCLEFAILNACRSGEVRGATWSELDLNAGTWSIPGERMKSGRPHRIPLSAPVITLLAGLPRFEGTDLIFPGRDIEKPLSDMSLTLVMRRMKLTAVPHGFRSTFTDWTAERTAYPAEVREMALAHAIGNDTEAAYRRGDLFDKRRQLMSEWAAFVNTAPAIGDNVVRFKAG